jgi:hypothetical protein
MRTGFEASSSGDEIRFFNHKDTKTRSFGALSERVFEKG